MYFLTNSETAVCAYNNFTETCFLKLEKVYDENGKLIPKEQWSEKISGRWTLAPKEITELFPLKVLENFFMNKTLVFHFKCYESEINKTLKCKFKKDKNGNIYYEEEEITNFLEKTICSFAKVMDYILLILILLAIISIIKIFK